MYGNANINLYNYCNKINYYLIIIFKKLLLILKHVKLNSRTYLNVTRVHL